MPIANSLKTLNVQAFYPKDYPVEAVQFTGENMDEVVDFLVDRGVKARKGSRKWIAVEIFEKNYIHPVRYIIRPYDFVVLNKSGIKIRTFEEFEKEYYIERHHAVVFPPYS